MPLLTITRKQLGDTRWSLLCSCLAFYGLAVLWNWGVSVNQFPPPEWERRDASRQESRDGESTRTQQTAGSSADGEAEAASSTADRTSSSSEPDPMAERADGPLNPPAAGKTADASDGSSPDAEASATQGEREDGEDQGRRRPGRRRGTGIYAFFGVPADRLLDPEDPPTLAMQVALANHPLITLALLGWAIARGSASVAGEIERGSLDLTLSRPVYRSTYLTAQILTTVISLLLLAITMVVGHVTAPLYFPLKNVPSWTEFFPSILMVMGFGLAIYGYTVVFSSADLVRARVGIIGLGITLGGIAGIVFARQYEGYEWVENLSIYHFYWPVGIVVDWSREISRNLMVLYGVFATGVALAYLIFMQRDLPTSGG